MPGGTAAWSGEVPVKKSKINTMSELSKAIGVSRPTLSRFFQDPESVSPASRKRINQALERVDYVPNFFFTRLNRKSTGLIGVIIPHLNDPFFTSLLDVIELEAMKVGFTIITQGSHGDQEVEARASEKLLSMNPDGVLVAPLGAEGSDGALERLSANIPLVFVDSRLPGRMLDVDFVGTNNRQSIGVMVEYLCRTGVPPVFLGMPRVNSNSLEREESYRIKMQELGHAPVVVDPCGVEPTWEFEAYALQVMEEHFGRGRYANATILCANDRLAFGVLRAANNHGLFAGRGKTRRSIRIAGHDDNPVSRFMTPALTTMAQDVGALGRAAIETLRGRITNDTDPANAPRIQAFDAALKVREST